MIVQMESSWSGAKLNVHDPKNILPEGIQSSFRRLTKCVKAENDTKNQASFIYVSANKKCIFKIPFCFLTYPRRTENINAVWPSRKSERFPKAVTEE